MVKKKQKLVNVVCERPLIRIKIISLEYDIYCTAFVTERLFSLENQKHAQVITVEMYVLISIH